MIHFFFRLGTQVKRYGPYTALYDHLRLLYGPYYRRNIGRRNTDRKVTVYESYCLGILRRSTKVSSKFRVYRYLVWSEFQLVTSC